MRHPARALHSRLLDNLRFSLRGIRASHSCSFSQPKQSERQRKKQQKKAKDELSFEFDRFLEEDGKYLLTPDEVAAFRRLGTTRSANSSLRFLAATQPRSRVVNQPFKEEHYRRIAYANEHFASGIPGWKNRSRPHLHRLGPPDEIDSHLRAAPMIALYGRAVAPRKPTVGNSGAIAISKASATPLTRICRPHRQR